LSNYPTKMWCHFHSKYFEHKTQKPSTKLSLNKLGAIHLWRPHGGEEVVRLRWTHVDGGEEPSPMWTSTQKIKIRVHWHHPVFFSCKEVGIFRLWTE